MAATANRGLIGLFKRGWHEIPEVMGSAALGLLGLGICVYSNILYYQKDGNNRRYKPHYTVYRDDDPRVATLKTQCDLTSTQ